ncbi:hypothetical protein RDI58_002418 [Solanum bulbocastanum]|uniref:Uncharacterized protein n=1 Tax=Solanum bulbocastanum TaxID=147425 RepID=A0AAN8U6Q2_SOLBU
MSGMPPRDRNNIALFNRVQCSKTSLDEIIIVMATIWTLLFDGLKSLIDIKGRSLRPEIVIQKAARFWQDWTTVRIPTSSFIVIEPDFATQWFPPGENIFKCNIDSSWDLASRNNCQHASSGFSWKLHQSPL